jgi:hypothetical protein
LAGYGGFSILDFDGEKSSLQFYTGNITVASLPGTLTQFGDLRNAIDGIILGTVSSESLKVFDTKLSNVNPTDEFAQRESKWLVVYEDNLPFFDAPVNAIPNEGFGKVFTFEIATADLSLLQAGTDRMIINAGAGQDFVTAFEDIARSPYGGTTNVLEVRHVGRNL